MKHKTKYVILGEIQEKRIWIHNIKLGFGKWIDLFELAKLVEKKTKTCSGCGFNKKIVLSDDEGDYCIDCFDN